MKTKKQNKRMAKVFFAGGKAKMSKAGYGQSGKMLSTMKRMMAVDASSDTVKHPPKRKATPHLDIMKEMAKVNSIIGRMADNAIRPNWISMIPDHKARKESVSHTDVRRKTQS